MMALNRLYYSYLYSQGSCEWFEPKLPNQGGHSEATTLSNYEQKSTPFIVAPTVNDEVT